MQLMKRWTAACQLLVFFFLKGQFTHITIENALFLFYLSATESESTADAHSPHIIAFCTWYSNAEQNAVVDDRDEAQDAFGLLQLLRFQV